ncbi:hypothetical protein GQ53DRAFT_748116 [Thozetella sp. PMI_491]|nr:hypothetical protein GQ53DRAFT_748116 [Thozetella sp. PMI_491]
MSDTTVKPEEAPAAPVEDAPPAVETTTEAVAGDKQTEVGLAEEEGDAKESKLNMLETTRAADSDPRKNKKFDPKTQQTADEPEPAIRKQVEFYFGDANLPSDEFLWNLTGGSDNKPVPVDVICKFKRMQVFERATVVAALRESKFLDIEGEEGEETIKRKKAYVPDDARWVRKVASTVYVKGFGDEEASTQFDLESFFSSFGPVNSVRLRRDFKSNLFKGSVYVEFPSEEAAKAFVDLDPAPKWKEHDLKIMTKVDYMAEKNELIKSGKLQPSDDRHKAFYEGKGRHGKSHGRGRGRGRGGFGRDDRGDIDRDDWNRRRDNDRRNGFKDGRGRGRGRGRGGHGRDFRDRKESARAPAEETRPSTNDVKRPVIQATDDNGNAVKENTNGKRSHDGETADAPPAKKIDTKSE